MRTAVTRVLYSLPPSWHAALALCACWHKAGYLGSALLPRGLSAMHAQCILNGVIGWGLDAAEDINATFNALHRVLRPKCVPESCALQLPRWKRWAIMPVECTSDAGRALHCPRAVPACRAPLVLGYNKPVTFAYWNDGLQPLFREATLGDLPHTVSASFSLCRGTAIVAA